MSPPGQCAYLESDVDKGERQEDKQRCHCSFSTFGISTECLGYINIWTIVNISFESGVVLLLALSNILYCQHSFNFSSTPAIVLTYILFGRRHSPLKFIYLPQTILECRERRQQLV